MGFWLTSLGGYLVGSVASQSLLDLFVVFMFLGWMSLAFKKAPDWQSIKWNWVGIEWAFLAYFIVVCLGFYFNAARDAEWPQALLKFLWVFHFYILIFSFQQVKIQIQPLLKYFCAFFLFPTLYSFTGYINGFDPITGRENGRVMGLVNSATYHAHGNALILVFFSAILFLNWQRIVARWRWFTLVCLVLLGMSILLTFTRGIWLSLFVSTIFMFVFYDYKKGISICLVGLFFAASSYFLWPQFRERIHHSTSPSENSERLNLFKVNVQIWREYPWLGIGYTENIRRNREYWDRPEWRMPPGYITSHAHNQFLNVLSTTGILGLIPFLCFWLFFLRKNWKLMWKTDYRSTPFRYSVLFGCMWAQVEFLLGCLSDVSFEYAKIRAIVLLIWALVVAVEIKPDLLVEEKSQ